jgi:hypothetical protein
MRSYVRLLILIFSIELLSFHKNRPYGLGLMSKNYSLANQIAAINDNITVTDISSLLLPGWESFDANTKPMLIRSGKLCLIRGIVKCTDISKGGILGNLPVLPVTYAGSICECFSDKAISNIYVTTYPNAGLVYQNQGGRTLTLNASYIINATYYTA